MLIEYEATYGGSCVKFSQRICPCSCNGKPYKPESTGTIWRSLGASYFEALGGSGLETGYPGGSGLESTGTDGGSGLETSTTGGSGLETSSTGGRAHGRKPIVIFGPIVTWE